MTLELAARAFEVLLGWSLLLQSLEQLRVQALDRVSDWAIQRDEVPSFPGWLPPLLDRLFQPGPYRAMLVLRALLAVALMAGLLLRWRGAFNGGSDFMTLAGLTGLLLAHAAGWRAGLWWVTLQALSSYFVSGWVKLLRAEWRTGRALPFFLDSGVYGPLPAGSLFRHPRVAQACAWAFTLWEGCFPLALLDPRLAAAFCAVAATFHFLVFWYFGLNRFFWAWMTTYPAILYAAS